MIANTDVSLSALYTGSNALPVLAWDADGCAMVRPRGSSCLKRADLIPGFEGVVSRFQGFAHLIPAPEGARVAVRAGGEVVLVQIVAWGAEAPGSSRPEGLPPLPTPLVLSPEGDLVPVFSAHDDENIVGFFLIPVS